MAKFIDTPLGRLRAFDEGTDPPGWTPESSLTKEQYIRLYGGLAKAGGYTPSIKLTDTERAYAIVAKIMESTKKRLDATQQTGVYNDVLEALRAGASESEIIKKVSSDVSASIKAGLEADPFNTEGRLSVPGQGGQTVDPSGFSADVSTGLIKLPNGNWYDPRNKLFLDAKGELISSATNSRTAAQENESNAAAGAHAASAASSYATAAQTAMRTKILQDNAAKAGTSDGLGQGYVWDGEGRPVIAGTTANEDRTFKQTADRLLQEHQSRTDDRIQRGEISANELAQARYASNQTASLRQQEINQTGTYQQGQLRQGDARLALDRQVAERQAQSDANRNALAKDEYVAKLLSNPADFIARAFTQRGEASPSTRVTQADLINNINTQFANSPTTFAAPKEVPTFAYGTMDSGPKGRLAQTYVHDKMAVVGDPQTDGGPNPEIIHNPTGAPISVTPMRDVQGTTSAPQQSPAASQGPQNTPEVDPKVQAEEKSADAIAKLLQHVKDPTTMHRLVDELSDHRGRLEKYAYGTSGDMSMYADGTDGPSTTWMEGTNYGYLGLNPQQAADQADQITPPLGQSGSYMPTAESRSAGLAMAAGGLRAPQGATYRGQAINPGSVGFNSKGTYYSGADGSLIYADQLDSATGWKPQQRLVSQAEIVSAAEQNLPPALRQLFGGIRPAFDTTTNATQNPENPTGVNSLRMGFNLFSPEAFNQLTEAEKQALNSYLAVKYNTNLKDVTTAMQQSYGVPRTRRGRLSLA